MEHCHVCGSHKKICPICGAELHKKFDDFIVRSEIIYAIFMAWGFAASAEAVIRQKSWVNIPLLIISTFVLIRFFFAPTRNLFSAALVTEKKPNWRWLVFLVDFPFLIFHSFAYYSMCLAISEGGSNSFHFFQWFVILLSANVLWLASIALRMRLLGKKKHFATYIKWCINNFITVILFALIFLIFTGNFFAFFAIFFTKGYPLIINQAQVLYWALFGVALLNCCADFILTASDYLGFES
ncbi:MAG: hypothetical protein PHO03_02440 [Candidatus Omnitrophica bacterium]|nr:hypothetical protein [Candidatus Omnitrophota bacterium]